MKAIKTILMYLPYVIVCVISFTVVSILDVILLLMALCVKAVRLIIIWLEGFTSPDFENSDTKYINTLGNAIVNLAYKKVIDEMYPVEEDEEESE